MSDPVRNGGKHPFEYHKPTEAQVTAMQLVNDHFKATYNLMMNIIPSNRERSIAVTKLQEARMWTNAAVLQLDS